MEATTRTTLALQVSITATVALRIIVAIQHLYISVAQLPTTITMVLSTISMVVRMDTLHHTHQDTLVTQDTMGLAHQTTVLHTTVVKTENKKNRRLACGSFYLFNLWLINRQRFNTDDISGNTHDILVDLLKFII